MKIRCGAVRGTQSPRTATTRNEMKMRFIKASNCDVAFAMQWHRPGRQKRRLGGQKALSTYTTWWIDRGARVAAKSSRRSVSSLCVNRLCNRRRPARLLSIKLTFQTRLSREPGNKWDVKPLLQIESKLLCALLPPSLPASFRFSARFSFLARFSSFCVAHFTSKTKKNCFSSHLWMNER